VKNGYKNRLHHNPVFAWKGEAKKLKGFTSSYINAFSQTVKAALSCATVLPAGYFACFYSPQFSSRKKATGKTAQETPAPRPRNRKVKIAPFRYRSISQFLQLIYAALFCAEFTSNTKAHRKHGTKKPGCRSMIKPPPKKSTAAPKRL
jgi:hypothetical protein